MSTTNSDLRPSQPPPAASSSTTTTASAPATTLAKPPTDIHPTAHLDPAAYVLGTHPISIAPQVLIHPRARLISTHGPLIIDTGTIITERCIVGGPAPAPAPILDPSTTNPAPGLPLTAEDADDAADDDLPLKTTLGSSVLLHPSCTIHAGATLQASCIIEPHATVLPSVTIGSHAKVCAGVTVDRDVADWEVVLGDGKQRRKRTPDPAYEDVRLRALERDREGTMGLLREAAKKALAMGKQRKS
jgi:dynactin-6